ncbi:MAG: ABC transporter permease [Kocuria sp.]|uniref:ABC transporter permease n=1 Tax=Kocuria sp. TaxID=1871328 RepID=UPI0026DD2C8B|nr:ABC transporter permease [Kocuria sp.]MDO4257527.1 ABC transporter permease [Kocuria sp.]
MPRRVLAQARFETMTMVRNGEQLLLLVILPVMALVGLTFTDLLDPYRVDGASRVDVAVPGILVLCVISSAFSGQGIQTGFDRRYGVLRYLSTTPLGRSGLIAGKLLAILAVLVLQYLVIAAVAAWLGWRPSGLAVLASIPLLVLVAVAFTGLGMLIAGTLRAEATLAVLNVVWVALAAGGGVLFPLAALPGWLSWLVALLPSSAAGELVRECFLGTPATLAPLLVLGVWAVLSWAATVKWFRWV